MSKPVKLLIGLAASLLLGFLWHGPLGNGARLIDRIETEARAAAASSQLPGIQVSLGHDPLSRAATISGTANDLQREGMGSQMGVADYVRAVEGIGPVRWSDEPEKGGLPLLAETLLLTLLAFLIGLALAWLFWRRPKRESFL